MVEKKRADLRGIGSKEKHLTGKSKRFISSNYTQFARIAQCKYCRSEYMRFAVNGYCQRCQQQAEYVIRERSEIAARIGPGGRL